MTQEDGTVSPTGETHPGEIHFVDQVDGREWTRAASEVPRSVAWKALDDRWVAVTKIEITGTPERREMTSFGRDGEFLQTSVQSPPRPR